MRAIIRLTGVSQDCDRKTRNAIAKPEMRSQNQKCDCLRQQLALSALKKEHPRGSGQGG
ncbi:MAG: hypothetical protein F6J98_12295 [Moorea sp. SIO4G2]|uniref:hypothetical protein n=1 Tax=Moorena sp. SIO4A1 TaxID=2607835 RepID=UPI0013FAA6AF|nr:hypothetical protein [Moorena sp. SIO4A1]NEO61182.1 hypothetical protein [Moorena sp. SIO4G2]NEQ63117.1 hypothetical protein [Moorena sp. SIO4A1]